MQFYTVSDNSFAKHSFPWVMSITQGLHYLPRCRACGREDVATEDALAVRLLPQKGNKWPDVLGCGAFPLLIISSLVVDGFKRESFGNLPLKRIILDGELPAKLKQQAPPEYFCLEGARLRGAELDAEASGFVGVTRCGVCVSLVHDGAATRSKQRANRSPLVIAPHSWRGLNLFTTELNPYYFFGTEELVRLARRYTLTNFRFVPVEEGDPAGHQGIDYMHHF